MHGMLCMQETICSLFLTWGYLVFRAEEGGGMYLLWPAETTQPLPVPPAICFQLPSCALAGPGTSSLLGSLGTDTTGL